MTSKLGGRELLGRKVVTVIYLVTWLENVPALMVPNEVRDSKVWVKVKL